MFRKLRAVLVAMTVATAPARVLGAEATTGAIDGRVVDTGGAPVAGARVAVASRSAAGAATSDAHGVFRLFGLAPDTYTVSVSAGGFVTTVETDVTVTPGGIVREVVRVARADRDIGRTSARTAAFSLGATADTFAVTGDAARAAVPPASASGLGAYAAGTVQGALAGVPGIVLDPFANAIARGGTIDDTVFEYDAVPLPQGLVAEPGGNVIGAQLPTTGVATTLVTEAGFVAQGDNALGAIVDQIPATGTHPGQTQIEATSGIGSPRLARATLRWLDASPDGRWRYAFATTIGSEAFAFGDRRTFYPAEAATFGLALQNRSETSAASNVHLRLDPADDLALVVLTGSAAYAQYGSPFAGQTIGAFNGVHTAYPGERDPNAPVTDAAATRGTFAIANVAWLHTTDHGTARLQLYQSQYGASSGGPFWDDNGFPNGSISFRSSQFSRENGLTEDLDVLHGAHHLRYGAQVRLQRFSLDTLVPTYDAALTAAPTVVSQFAYAADTWQLGSRLDLTGALRSTHATLAPSNAAAFSILSLDPHLALGYRVAPQVAVRATFDRTSAVPKPLEANEGGGPLGFETATQTAISVETAGRTTLRATYYGRQERNRLAVLPADAHGGDGSAVSLTGVPTNAGRLVAHGVELFARRDGWSLSAQYTRAFSSTATQFALPEANLASIAADQLIPVGYIPDLAVTLARTFTVAHGVRITPSVAYTTGYPYGNGTQVWITDPATGRPVAVPNDNHVDPGANYFFLRDPAQPYDATTNPYIATQGTTEGPTPNTLRAPTHLQMNLHAEADLRRNVTLVLDVDNLFADATPTALMTNPYLIGPPGYAGGDAAYGAAYAPLIGASAPYALGNGVPTNDGVHQSVPWAYGRDGYVAQSYPQARSVTLGLRVRW